MIQTKEQAFATIKKLHSEWREEFGRAAERSWTEAVNALPSGATRLPERGRIHGEKNQAEFMALSDSYKQKAAAALKDYGYWISGEKSKAPTEEALRAVQAYKMIDPGTMSKDHYQAELQGLIDRFGDNYMIHQALVSMANKANVSVTPNKLVQEVANYEYLSDNVKGLFDGYNAAYHGQEEISRETFAVSMLDQQLGE